MSLGGGKEEENSGSGGEGQRVVVGWELSLVQELQYNSIGAVSELR